MLHSPNTGERIFDGTPEDAVEYLRARLSQWDCYNWPDQFFTEIMDALREIGWDGYLNPGPPWPKEEN